MDKKLTKSMKIWCLRNKQTYPTVQIATDNTITQRHTLKLASLKLLISEQLPDTTMIGSVLAITMISYLQEHAKGKTVDAG